VRLFSQITASIVLYQHRAGELRPLFEALAREPAVSAWTVVNNGGSEDACVLASSLGGRCLHPNCNLGYGAAHNLAWRDLAFAGAPFHVILNPDVLLKSGTLADLAKIMAEMPEAGLLMPRVVYPDGREQRLCKLLPTPFDLFLRRFLGKAGNKFFRGRSEQYELRALDMSIPREVPCLSGCFMFLRTKAIRELGLFDERYFMYMEDVDLCRRIGSRYKTVFYPHISIVHGYAKGSYANLRLTAYHVHSALKYFAKWKWFRDDEREALNRRVAPLYQRSPIGAGRSRVA
jgi:GT2 family glycosyltransferase